MASEAMVRITFRLRLGFVLRWIIYGIGRAVALRLISLETGASWVTGLVRWWAEHLLVICK